MISETPLGSWRIRAFVPSIAQGRRGAFRLHPGFQMPARMAKAGNHRKEARRVRSRPRACARSAAKRAGDRVVIGEDRRLQPLQLFDAHRGGRGRSAIAVSRWAAKTVSIARSASRGISAEPPFRSGASTLFRSEYRVRSAVSRKIISVKAKGMTCGTKARACSRGRRGSFPNGCARATRAPPVSFGCRGFVL